MGSNPTPSARYPFATVRSNTFLLPQLGDEGADFGVRQCGMVLYPTHLALRKPRHVSMWDRLANFAATATEASQRDVWTDQPARGKRSVRSACR